MGDGVGEGARGGGTKQKTPWKALGYTDPQAYLCVGRGQWVFWTDEVFLVEACEVNATV